MPLAALIAAVTAVLCLAMALAWGLQRRTGDGGWADVVWSFATGAAGVAYALAPTAGFRAGPRALLVALLAAAWSVRLGAHLWRRTVRARAEDARYAELRQAWGAGFQARMFGFLQVQAAASALLALAMLAAARNPAPFPAWSDAAGLGLFVLAIAGESVADAQLARFKAAPGHRGRLCEAGLWGWSRHPNYFFEWLGWLAYAAIAIGPDFRRPASFVALVGPTLMFVLLRHVSGVPATERAMAKSRGPLLAAYQARVSPFVPLPPRRRTISETPQ